MKRAELVRKIVALGAELIREGGNHTLYVNPRTRVSLVIPRHREIKELLAHKIIREAERG